MVGPLLNFTKWKKVTHFNDSELISWIIRCNSATFSYFALENVSVEEAGVSRTVFWSANRIEKMSRFICKWDSLLSKLTSIHLVAVQWHRQIIARTCGAGSATHAFIHSNESQQFFLRKSDLILGTYVVRPLQLNPVPILHQWRGLLIFCDKLHIWSLVFYRSDGNILIGTSQAFCAFTPLHQISTTSTAMMKKDSEVQAACVSWDANLFKML